MKSVLSYVHLTLLVVRVAYAQPAPAPPPPAPIPHIYIAPPPAQGVQCKPFGEGLAAGHDWVPTFDPSDCIAIITKIPALQFHPDRQGSERAEDGKLTLHIPKDAYQIRFPPRFVHGTCEATAYSHYENESRPFGLLPEVVRLKFWQVVKEDMRTVFANCMYDGSKVIGLGGFQTTSIGFERESRKRVSITTTMRVCPGYLHVVEGKRSTSSDIGGPTARPEKKLKQQGGYGSVAREGRV